MFAIVNEKSHGTIAGAIAVDEAILNGLVNNSSDWLILPHTHSLLETLFILVMIQLMVFVGKIFLLVACFTLQHIIIIYRVAQNKIPHRRICNISATSGLILNILQAA